MSSSRSVAAARARRAPETSSQSAFKPQNTQQMQQQQQQSRVSSSKQPMTPYQPPQSSVENKLSVSDAFALVTLRLGRVEMLLQKWQSMGVESESGVNIPVAASSTPDVNNTIVKSLVSRLDDLERNIKASVSMKDFESKMAILSDRNMQLHNELRDAKDTIFKLQSMTLDTSQKIMTMMMARSIPAVKEALTIEIPEYNEDSAGSADLEHSNVELEGDVQGEEEAEQAKAEGEQGQGDHEEVVELAQN